MFGLLQKKKQTTPVSPEQGKFAASVGKVSEKTKGLLEQAKVAKIESDKQNSFGGLVKNTLKEIPGQFKKQRSTIQSYVNPTRAQQENTIQKEARQTLLPDELKKRADERDKQMGYFKLPGGGVENKNATRLSAMDIGFGVGSMRNLKQEAAETVGRELKEQVNRIAPSIDRKISGVLPKAKQAFEGFQDLSLRTIEDLKGKAQVSKQYISDLTNRGDLKQPERDLIRRNLESEPDQIDVPAFANKVKSELLPLDVSVEGSVKLGGTKSARHEGVTLSDVEGLRGPVAHYAERVYQSPIKTSAGNQHGFDTDRYFAHSRIEDLPEKTGTRRVIEIQSDLFQKGRLEGEANELSEMEKSALDGTYKDIPESTRESFKQLAEGKSARLAEVAKLEPYRNTWHERVIREEVKKAAQDGKTKLQFPTGETAMKIEGLGDRTRWHTGNRNITLEQRHLKVGEQVEQEGGGSWIITDVLGDGKFKAAPKKLFDEYVRGRGEVNKAIRALDEDTLTESFDISGKVDTNNPIYRFYEKEAGRYLTNKYGAKRVKDAQGVEWYEINLNGKGFDKAPVEAYGAVAGIEQDEEGKLSFSPEKAGMGILGVAGMARGKKFIKKGVVEGNPLQTLKNVEARVGVKPTEIDQFRAGRGNNPKVGEDGMPVGLTKRQRGILEKARLEREGVQRTTPASQSPSPVGKPILEQVTEGEARSIEKQAEEYLQRANSKGDVGGVPLTKMIEGMQTPVNKKVNLLDYIRTPDRVLKKIGLEKEAKYLQRQYDGYLKELPENIDRITAWSKEVPKESNERIFKWLDGQAIDLREEERVVAKEIKQWLELWADRLGIPNNQRFSNYITHIFDDQLIKKEFDEDLAKIIRDKIPGEVYDPFLQKRLGQMGYIQDTWRALDAYVKRGTRKVWMDPALRRIEDKASGFEDSQWNYVKKYIDRVNLRPTDVDNLLDNAIKSIPGIGYKFGQRPVARISRTARQMVYRALLGLNPASAIKNLSQGANTYATLGEKYTTIGYAKLFNPKNFEELTKEGILNHGFIQDRALSATQKFWEKADKGLFVFFEGAEKINRGAAYFGAKSKGLAKGMGEREAVEYAKEIVRKTQFTFGSVDTPLILQSDLGKTLGQFQSFTTKQTEFLTEMAINKDAVGLMRYSLAGLAFVYSIGKMFGMEPKDLIPHYRFDTPPVLKLGEEIARAGFDTPDDYGNDRDTGEKLKDIRDAGLLFVPGSLQAKKTYQGLKAVKEGGSYTKSGSLQYEVPNDAGTKIKAGLFGKYALPQAREYYDKKEGKLKDKEIQKFEEAETEESGERNKQAHQLYRELKKLPPEEAFAELKKLAETDPKLAKKVYDMAQEDKLGLEERDKQIKALGVESGARARYMVEQFNKLQTKEEKAKLWDEYTSKKLMSKEVEKQVRWLLENPEN